MKKKIFAIACLILTIALSTILFDSCDKDTNCYVEVTVVDETTLAPISGAFVKIDIDSSYINAQGITNAAGRFDAVFAAPAIFNVNVTYEDGYDETHTPAEYYCYRTGSNTIKLKEGDTVAVTVNVEAYVHKEFRQ